MTTATKPLYTHYFRERKALLEAALVLVREGRFQHSVMSEIAFHARLSESTALHFFSNRATLAKELAAFVQSEIAVVVCAEIESSTDSITQFKNAWAALYRFYVRNVAVYKFVDQASVALSDPDALREFHTGLNKPFEKIFDAHGLKFSREVSAALAHAHIVGMAKVAFEQHITLSKDDLAKLSRSTWQTLVTRH